MSNSGDNLADFDLDDLIGQLINNNYLLEDKIGEGGMGAVFRAIDIRNGDYRAVKVISPQLISNNNEAKRFLREARLGLILSHPGIVKVYEFGETTEGLLFMVMEYIEGKPLIDLIEEEAPFAPARIISILEPLCEALDYAHSHNVLHRDLKPGNIIVIKDEQGRESSKLVDFGIMKLLKADDQMSNVQLTDTNVVLGTPDYMSPEQLVCHELKPTADVYSLGVILYQMLTGGFPIDYFDFAEFLMLKVYRDAEPPSTRFAFIPPELDTLILKVLARDPEQRYQSAGALYRAYLQTVCRLPAAVQQPDAETLAQRRKK
jgi:eukaryotic-like serine/threonine-protein kinase